MKYRIFRLELTSSPWFFGWPRAETTYRWCVVRTDSYNQENMGNCDTFDEAREAVAAFVSAKPGELVMLPKSWRRKP